MKTTFSQRPTQRKVTCDICGSTGYGVLDPYSLPEFSVAPWQRKCMLPHDHHCSCGKRYPTLAHIAAHVRAQKRWYPRTVHVRGDAA